MCSNRVLCQAFSIATFKVSLICEEILPQGLCENHIAPTSLLCHTSVAEMRHSNVKYHIFDLFTLFLNSNNAGIEKHISLKK